MCRIYLKGQHYVLWLKEARADQMKSACRRQRKTDTHTHTKRRGNTASKKEQSHTKHGNKIMWVKLKKKKKDKRRGIKEFKSDMRIHP